MMREQVKRARAYVGGGGLGPFLVRAVAGSGAVRVGSMLASFTVGVQLARGLGVEGYGYYGLALAAITIVGIPAEMGLPRLVTREVAASAARDDTPHLFGVLRWANSVGMRFSALMATGIIVAALILAAERPSELPLALLVGAPIIPFMALARINGGALQGLHHIVRGQIPQNLLRQVFFSILLAGLYIFGAELDPAGAMALYALTAGIALFITYRWLRERLPAIVPAEVVRGGRRWFASTIPMALTEGMRVLQTELSILLVGLIAAPAAVGIFRIASVTAMIAATPTPVVVHVAMPVMARLHAQGDQVRLQKAVTGLAWSGFAGVVILSLPLLVAAEPLLKLVFGDSYGPAATALQILAVGQIINGAFGPNAAILNMTHNERRVTRAMGSALVLNLVLVPLLMLPWGLAGAAVGLVASMLCWNLLTWLDARRILNIETSVAHALLPAPAGQA